MTTAVRWLVACIATVACLAGNHGVSWAQETIARQCLRCHTDYKGQKDLVAGSFINRSKKAGTVQLRVGKQNFIIKLDENTVVKEGPGFSKNIPVSVRFRQEGPDMVANEISAMPPIEVPKDELIFGEQLADLIEDSAEEYTLVDSRPEARYIQGHIPTAISIPFDQMDEMKAKLPKVKHQLLVFYCGGEHCTLSPMAAEMAKALGYTHVKVYHAGTPDWADLGKPMLTTHQYLLKHPSRYVLVDTRGKEAAAKGRLPGAVAITPEELEEKESQFPLDRKASIVLYNESGNLDELTPLIELITIWGYRNIYIVDGGYKGWVTAGQPVETGTPPTEIVYNPKPLPGEISTDEFAYMIENTLDSKVILDVRNPEEAASGAIPDSINIPVDEIRVRIDELPKDKEIIVHCATGVRAEMGFSILKDAGYKTRFLNDNITIIGHKVYLGTTLTLPQKAQDDEELPDAGRIQVTRPDTALCARLIRFGQTAMDRRKYQQAKEFFWKAIMADPTSQLAWSSYDMSVIFALANQAQQNPAACVGIPDSPVTEPVNGGLGGMKEEEGC